MTYVPHGGRPCSRRPSPPRRGAQHERPSQSPVGCLAGPTAPLPSSSCGGRRSHTRALDPDAVAFASAKRPFKEREASVPRWASPAVPAAVPPAPVMGPLGHAAQTFPGDSKRGACCQGQRDDDRRDAGRSNASSAARHLGRSRPVCRSAREGGQVVRARHVAGPRRPGGERCRRRIARRSGAPEASQRGRLGRAGPACRTVRDMRPGRCGDAGEGGRARGPARP